MARRELVLVLVILTALARVSCRSLEVENRGTPNMSFEVEARAISNITLAGLPESLDWRARGAVTLPKDQGRLGSCWAFAAVATIEGLKQIKTGKLVTLSTQQLVDCIGSDTLRSPRNAFEWVLANGGITSDADYPYTGRQGSCVKSKLNHYAAKITGYKRVEGTELALMEALQKQPVAVSMRLDAQFFNNYKAGMIYNGPCGYVNNHAMAVVGYSVSEEGVPYWIVKNSFGPDWGDNGYVHIRRGFYSDYGGLCGIAAWAIYPTMD